MKKDQNGKRPKWKKTKWKKTKMKKRPKLEPGPQ